MGETAGLKSIKEKLLDAGQHNWYSLMGVQETRLVHQLVSDLQSTNVPSAEQKQGRAKEGLQCEGFSGRV